MSLSSTKRIIETISDLDVRYSETASGRLEIALTLIPESKDTAIVMPVKIANKPALDDPHEGIMLTTKSYRDKGF
jgi:hypothetical protein